MTVPRLHTAFCNDVLVGAVAVRLERLPDGKAKLYFLTLGVLAAYRNYGVGACALCNEHLSHLQMEMLS
jgi:hypothetical protein